MSIDADVFSGIQFSKPIIRSNIDFTAISKFVSIDSTFSPGTSAAAHVEVDRLFSLLEGKKAKIDHILDSQYVYAVGIDFQKGYSMPCITCWVTKYLDIAIKEQLSDLFENEFEIIENILTPTDTDVNNSNSTPPSGNEKESKEKENDYNCSGNDEKNGDGTSEKENSNDNKDNGKEINDNNSNNDGDGGDGNGSITSDFKNIIVTSASRVITKESSEIFQEFDIVAAIHANVDPANGKHKILKFFVDVKECGMGPMISEKLSLHKLGL
ncbi:13077_t:CDS:2, partial [Racocetra fulgida]